MAVYVGSGLELGGAVGYHCQNEYFLYKSLNIEYRSVE